VDSAATLFATLPFSGDRAAMGGLTLVFSYTFSNNLQSANYLNNWNYLHEQPAHELVSFDKPQNIALSSVWALPFGKGRYFLEYCLRPAPRNGQMVSGPSPHPADPHEQVKPAFCDRGLA
jgi:hypothetical protein